ncbi:hypothetical protein ZIOFF_062987 [Zingiber officinale]|uniref:Uncharacterized protein n=1 Tax=Zingiber officinale TaxID=94328 RepID=A0A8J5F5M0_ZINOF|nr:hypothetical protein ZIOFF_062987 [Zingiber officinale]
MLIVFETHSRKDIGIMENPVFRGATYYQMTMVRVTFSILFFFLNKWFRFLRVAACLCLGESCNAVCSWRGKSCIPNRLLLLNRCDL